MKKTQRLIVIVTNNVENLNEVVNTIAGFHACTIVKNLDEEILHNVFHFNKNAVYFTASYYLGWSKFNPIVIRLTFGSTDVENGLLNIQSIIKDFPEVMSYRNIDVGDHASKDSTKVSCHSESKCLLCKIRDHKNENVEHILYETSNFYVVPGTGAFFDGYIMIVPKKHVMSFALLSDEELEEFHRVLNDLRSLLEAIYGKKVFAFECGSGRTGAGKHETSIVHAHFHLAATDMPVLKEVQKSGLNPALIDKRSLNMYGDYPYMLYVDQEDNWFIASDPHEYYPRQHPRQVLAEYMGCYDKYNWRIYPMRDRMDVIADEFRTFCKTNIDSLPKWVQSAIRFEDSPTVV